MQRSIFISLPVTDIARSRSFYQAIGFAINEAFSSPQTACFIVSDAISLMVATHESFQAISARPLVLPSQGATSLISLSCASRDEVDAMNAAAVAAGGSEVHGAEDLGFMYSRAFADPDGNGFGIMWMDPAA